jgi:hypothetical protein
VRAGLVPAAAPPALALRPASRAGVRDVMKIRSIPVEEVS